MGRARTLSLAALMATLWPASTRAAEVVVFPLEGRGVPSAEPDILTSELRLSIGGLPGMKAVDELRVERELGVQLGQQARSCGYDVFCLVEIGEILHSEQLLVGHVERSAIAGAPTELKLFVIDVKKSVIVDTLLWSIPNRRGSLLASMRMAAKRLFARPSTRVRLDLRPREAELFFYGEPLMKPSNGAVLLWPGDYDIVVRAEGYLPLETRLSVPETSSATVALELSPDPLYVKKSRGDGSNNPFAKPSKREGSGVTATDVETDVDVAERVSGFSNWLGWTTASVGLVTSVVGVAIASRAQHRYNEEAAELRFADGTPSAFEAREVREAERRSFKVGALLVGSGAAALVGGLAWMLLDATLSRPSSELGRSPARPSVSGGFEVVW